MSNLVVKIWFSFFRLILTLLHFAYSGYLYLDFTLKVLKRNIKSFLELRVFDARLFVSEFVTNLEKCPAHFVVIVGKDGINVKDFSNLVIWCLAAKISFVSFYDYSGYLKANENIYYKYLFDKRKIDPKSLVFNLGKLNSKNGVLDKIHLNILSLQDGKPFFVQLTKTLSQKIISNELKVAEINETFISKELFRYNGIPEPDLGVVCGTVFGTFGFLPWQIRVTEFLHIKSLKGIQVSEFTSMLKNYASCTQRFGK